MVQEDKFIENLLELDGMRYVIHESLGLWVKFEVKRITPTRNCPHGIRYSFSMHDKSNKRIMGFDNAHPIEYDKKVNVKAKRIYDHWHRDQNDNGRPYSYESAGKLMEDFWKAVDRVVKKLDGE